MTRIIPILKGVPITGSDGALGWSSVTLIQNKDEIILVDTGFHGNRHHLLQALDDNRIELDEVNRVILTHLHFDHCLNYDLFTKASFVLSRAEYEYVKDKKYLEVGDVFIPDILERIENRGLQLFDNELKIGQDIRCLLTPGHTPGSLSVLVDLPNGDRTGICGDLFKYAWEANLLPEVPQGTFGDIRELKTSQKMILDMGVKKLICGHDRPLSFQEKNIVFDETGDCEITLFIDTNSSIATNYKIKLAK